MGSVFCWFCWFWGKESIWMTVFSHDREEIKNTWMWVKKISVVIVTLSPSCSWVVFVFLQKSSTSSSVDNPCYPRNYEAALTLKYFCGSLCTQSLRPANYYPNQSVIFHGTGDPGLCQEMVSLLFNFTTCRNQEDCPFSGIHQPKVKGNFVVGFQISISFWTFLLLISVVLKVTGLSSAPFL